jgi:superfamily II RNA helicase
MTSSYLNIFSNKECTNIIPENEISYNFAYKLDAFQLEGIYRIHINENVLITAHTGSGKTVLAIYAIAHCLKQNKKVIYTSPTKSLSNQKYAEFINIFGKNNNVGILTGDIKMNPDAQCIIMTTEILRNILFKYNSNIENTLVNINDVGAIIFDEVHYINDPDRGKVWEESIILTPKNITLVMLSATIDKPEIFASWVGNIKEKNISLIPTSHRVVPLKYYFWKSYQIENNGKDEIHWKLLEITNTNYDIIKRGYKVYDINKLMDKLIDFLTEQNYIPALFFKFSRKKCESICKTVRKNLLTPEEINEVENTFHYYMKDFIKTYEILPQYQDVYKQLLKGVVYHHSGLIPILKEIIEILYSKGLVKILFATETFAIGVNMPTKTVLFTDLEKFDNNGQRYLRSDEFMQMSGRAGRRGLDLFGSVIILPTFELPDETSFKNILTGKSPKLNSKFKLTYQFVLKILYCNEFNTDKFLNNTFIMNENEKKIIFYLNDKINIENQINNINNKLKDISLDNVKKYKELYNKLNDKTFVLKKKEIDKIQKEISLLLNIENFDNILKIYDELIILNKKLDNINEYIWFCKNSLNYNINIIKNILNEKKYIQNEKITIKGIIASGINECNELIFSEMIENGLLDNLEFSEIAAILSSFINEKEQVSNEIYISDLKVSNNIKYVLKELEKYAKIYIDLEDKYELHICTDYKLYLDYIEAAYIWSSGGNIHEVYKNINVYDGNFVKMIMRLNNIFENLIELCNLIEKYELIAKIENYNNILIRDITMINSLYVT